MTEGMQVEPGFTVPQGNLKLGSAAHLQSLQEGERHTHQENLETLPGKREAGPGPLPPMTRAEDLAEGAGVDLAEQKRPFPSTHSAMFLARALLPCLQKPPSPSSVSPCWPQKGAPSSAWEAEWRLPVPLFLEKGGVWMPAPATLAWSPKLQAGSAWGRL